MGIKTLIMVLASLSFSVSALADHHEGEKKPFSIYGDFATSLSFYDNENAGAQTNHDDFNVNLIEINLEKNWSMSKLHLSIGYGSTAQAFNGPNATSANTLNVMNAYYHMHTAYGLEFMIGKFESPVGHETYNHMDNSQFTRSYGFNLAPYFSTGAELSYGQAMWRAGLIVANGSGKDTDTNDKNKTMTLVVDVDPMDNLHFDLNYVTGTENSTAAFAGADYQVSIIDFTASFMVNEMLDFALNYIGAAQNPVTTGVDEATASSIALYGNANFGMFGLGLRYEMMSYDGAMNAYNGSTGPALASVGTDNDLSAITLAASAEIDQNARVMLEYRMDSSDDQIFVDKDGAATDSFNTITAALMYRF